MGMLPKVFDSTGVDTGNVMPVGWYTAEIVKSVIKENNAKNGQHLTFQFKIIDNDDYNGRIIFQLLNLVHPNQTAVMIAEKELANICTATGVDVIEDSEELHNIPMMIKVGIQAETAQWPAKNVIKGYKSMDESDNGEDSPF